MAASILRPNTVRASRVPDHAEIFARWTRAAEDLSRRDAQARPSRAWLVLRRYAAAIHRSVPAAKRAKQRRLALFIHGGYWRAMDPSFHSHMARGSTSAAVRSRWSATIFARSSPSATSSNKFAAPACFSGSSPANACWSRGHSAGGHLDRRHGGDRLAHALSESASRSGAGWLCNFRRLRSGPLTGLALNQDLRLDAEEARRLSPLFWPVAPGRTLDAAVGDLEIE